METMPKSQGASPRSDETQLRPELLDGLDLAGCVKLRQQGIECVEDLASVEPLELARSMEIGVTRVMRLQFLARRHLQARETGQESDEALRDETLAPPVRPAPRFSPSETAFEFRTPELERELSSYSRRNVR